MDFAKTYLIIIGSILIAHRLPGLISPSFLKLYVKLYSSKMIFLRVGGSGLAILSVGAALSTVQSYFNLGWIVIGLAIVVGHKGLALALNPSKYGRREWNAWNQSDFNIRLICAASVLGGVGMIYLSYHLNFQFPFA